MPRPGAGVGGAAPAMIAEEETIAVLYPGALLPPWDRHLGLKKIHLFCF